MPKYHFPNGKHVMSLLAVYSRLAESFRKSILWKYYNMYAHCVQPPILACATRYSFAYQTTVFVAVGVAVTDTVPICSHETFMWFIPCLYNNWYISHLSQYKRCIPPEMDKPFVRSRSIWWNLAYTRDLWTNVIFIYLKAGLLYTTWGAVAQIWQSRSCMHV